MKLHSKTLPSKAELRKQMRRVVKREILGRKCPVCTANRGEVCGYDYAATREHGWVPGKNEQNFVHVERL